MKKIFGNLCKKSFYVLLTFILFQSIAYCYETVLINFPNDGWHRVYYETRKFESIVQYVPSGQTKDKFIETVVFHAYKYNSKKKITTNSILENILAEKAREYGDVHITRLKSTPTDSMVIWCSLNASQCEIFRSSQSYEGVITMHYVNNKPEYFQAIYPNWVEIMKDVKIYYSYYRWSPVFQKYYTVIL